MPPKNKNSGNFDFSESSKFTSIAQFLRAGKKSDIFAVFKHMSKIGLQKGNQNAKSYISTAGGAVYWLHIRICSRPKYYSSEYRNM